MDLFRPISACENLLKLRNEHGTQWAVTTIDPLEAYLGVWFWPIDQTSRGGPRRSRRSRPRVFCRDTIEAYLGVMEALGVWLWPIHDQRVVAGPGLAVFGREASFPPWSLWRSSTTASGSGCRPRRCRGCCRQCCWRHPTERATPA